MRAFLYAVAAVAVVITSSPDAIRSALAASASALIEATPFIAAGIALSRVFARVRIVEYLGCGCGEGPSARSLPAAAATWLLFGPSVAVARYVAALLVDRLLRCRAKGLATLPATSAGLLDQLAALLPAAIVAGAAMQFASMLSPQRLAPAIDAVLGASLGFTAAPCGLGVVAVAGALRVRAPIAAAAFLCVAGIVDLRALRPARHCSIDHDAFGYALLAVALAIVAWRRGDALVHPAFTGVLACSAVAAAICAAAYRQHRCSAARVAPAVMLIGALVGAPAPQYRASETTLTDLFAGEHLTFTGALARSGGTATIVRYAITCCRADAAPVAVRLDRPPPDPAGTWLRAAGTIEDSGGEFRLRVTSIQRIVPPTDPFIYR